MDCGFRIVQVSGLNNFTSSLEELEEQYVTYNDYHELCSYKLGFHAEYTTDKKLLEGLAGLSEKYHAPVYTHNSETKREVEECRQRYGKSPTQLFEEMGLYRYGGGGYHCIWFDDEDIDIFAKRQLSVVTNPASNLKLASGIAPLKKMQEAGINLAIGTEQLFGYVPGDVFSNRSCKVKRTRCSSYGCKRCAVHGNDRWCKGNGIVRLRLSGSWEKSGSVLNGPDAAEYAAGA